MLGMFWSLKKKLTSIKALDIKGFRCNVKGGMI